MTPRLLLASLLALCLAACDGDESTTPSSGLAGSAGANQAGTSAGGSGQGGGGGEGGAGQGGAGQGGAGQGGAGQGGAGQGGAGQGGAGQGGAGAGGEGGASGEGGGAGAGGSSGEGGTSGEGGGSGEGGSGAGGSEAGAGGSEAGSGGSEAGSGGAGAGGDGGNAGTAGQGGNAGQGGGSGAGGVGGGSGGGSLRFFGNGKGDIDRVKIDVTGKPVNVGAGAFTIEFWMKAASKDNPSGPCQEGNDAWINGHVIVDRDLWGPDLNGDFGISLYGGRISFGVTRASGNGNSICSSVVVADGSWHHVAAVRSGAQLRIFVDGQEAGQGTGPTGDVSYDPKGAAPPDMPNEKYLVLGAEKHDAGAEYPSYSGFLDELRISKVARYVGSFSPPAAPFAPDADTVGLYHFDEGQGTTLADSSQAPGGPSEGVLFVGGAPQGPLWSSESPF